MVAALTRSERARARLHLRRSTQIGLLGYGDRDTKTIDDIKKKKKWSACRDLKNLKTRMKVRKRLRNAAL